MTDIQRHFLKPTLTERIDFNEALTLAKFILADPKASLAESILARNYVALYTKEKNARQRQPVLPSARAR